VRWGVRYVVEPLVGLSRARNRGARACDSEIVAFLDDDALPEPEWLSGLLREFEDPLVMAVTGRILPLSVETKAGPVRVDGRLRFRRPGTLGGGPPNPCLVRARQLRGYR
jgi:cellulose synthase/poly-beta-1,6-N-acetylglucosamine synthase-like glycosyltransferase